MVHEILIEFDYFHKSKGLKRYLKYDEVPRGEVVGALFSLKNLGDAPFEGSIDEIRLEFNGMSTWNRPNKPISLKPGERLAKPFIHSFTMSLEGLCWIRCKLKANDNQPIKYRQFEQGDLLDEWMRNLVVVNREQLRTLALLTKIEKDLSNASQKAK